MDLAAFWVQYGGVLKLAFIFAAIIGIVKMKKPLSLSIAVGAILTVVLYGIPLPDALLISGKSIISQATILVVASLYLITFLQRMMEKRGDLDLAQHCMSRIFNSRRVNASITPAFIGLLPSPAAIFIAGSMVDKACGDYLSKEDKTFVASFYRHIPESFLPTYSSIIIACQLTGVSMGSFVLGMVPLVVLLFFLGWAFFLRKVPKETGEPASENKMADTKNLLVALWPIIAIIVLIVAFNWSVYTSTVAVIIVYFFTGKFDFATIKPYFTSSLEMKIVLNAVIVMIFKDLLTKTNIITELPALFSHLPIPTFLVFGLIFLVGSIVAGSLSMITLCLPMAFIAIPGAGMPLMVFLMGCTYMAMQVSPTHVCLTLASEYFGTDFSELIKRTIPVLITFFVLSAGYYLLLTSFA